MEKPYVPIDCNFVDHIEHMATLKKVVDIVYSDNGNLVTEHDDIIVTWINEGGKEYLITRNALKIRLDYIISIGGISLGGNSCEVDDM